MSKLKSSFSTAKETKTSICAKSSSKRKIIQFRSLFLFQWAFCKEISYDRTVFLLGAKKGRMLKRHSRHECKMKAQFNSNHPKSRIFCSPISFQYLFFAIFKKWFRGDPFYYLLNYFLRMSRWQRNLLFSALEFLVEFDFVLKIWFSRNFCVCHWQMTWEKNQDFKEVTEFWPRIKLAFKSLYIETLLKVYWKRISSQLRVLRVLSVYWECLEST